MANILDPAQMPCSSGFDLGLHYLLMEKEEKNQPFSKKKKKCHICISDEVLVLVADKKIKIKALTALVGRLSLSVGWENGPEQGLKPVSFNP